MIKTEDKQQCCGCSACESICKHKAISMRADNLGFMYPVVNETLCTDCGLCTSVCPFQNASTNHKVQQNPLAYAARHKDTKELLSSRSGAAFITLSDSILENNGVVYGAGYGSHFRVEHHRAETKEARDEFKGSKYAQSDISSIYASIRQDLINGRIVLFSGTPCQTAAVSAFVGKKLMQTLYLIDIVCHGVAAPKIWDDYLCYLERKTGKRIISVDFRDKLKYGWSGLHRESFLFEGETQRRYFDYTFYSDLQIRPSCHHCPYASVTRLSDITIGDFWGIEKINPDFNADDKGCSLVICNTSKGKALFDKAKEVLNIIPVEHLKDCVQPNMLYPTPINEKQEQYLLDYMNYGFEYVMNKYGRMNLGQKLVHYFRIAIRIAQKWIKE